MSRFGSFTEVSRKNNVSMRGRTSGGDFIAETSILTDFEKEQICLDLLEEFGARNVTVGPGGEIRHSCCLPFGLHANGDKNPSASLNYLKLTYSCFSCGGGGLLWFIATCRGESATEARKWVSNRSGSGTEEVPLSQILDFFDAVYGKKSGRPEPIPVLSERLLEPWRAIHPWLTEVRGIPEDNIIRHSVGYGIIQARSRIKGSDGEKSTSMVDSHRIIIPHFWRGDLVGWQSRRLTNDGTPKYLSTAGFPKDQTLYNATNGESVVVVESPMSVLRHSHHQPMSATFGASVTDSQTRLIGSHRKVILWFDNDPAGWKATRDVAKRLAPYVGEAFVVDSDLDADPGDLDDETVSELVKGAIPYSLWTKPQELRRVA